MIETQWLDGVREYFALSGQEACKVVALDFLATWQNSSRVSYIFQTKLQTWHKFSLGIHFLFPIFAARWIFEVSAPLCILKSQACNLIWKIRLTLNYAKLFSGRNPSPQEQQGYDGKELRPFLWRLMLFLISYNPLELSSIV